eukprot:355903-Chlamydomonas_euryale.AAC.5
MPAVRIPKGRPSTCCRIPLNPQPHIATSPQPLDPRSSTPPRHSPPTSQPRSSTRPHHNPHPPQPQVLRLALTQPRRPTCPLPSPCATMRAGQSTVAAAAGKRFGCMCTRKYAPHVTESPGATRRGVCSRDCALRAGGREGAREGAKTHGVGTATAGAQTHGVRWKGQTGEETANTQNGRGSGRSQGYGPNPWRTPNLA